jgi:hypothetical protein
MRKAWLDLIPKEPTLTWKDFLVVHCQVVQQLIFSFVEEA